MNYLKKYPSRSYAWALIIVTLLVAPFLFSKAQPYQPVQPLPPVPLLDLHCHTAGLGAGGSGCFISDEMRHSYKLRFYLKSLGVTEADILREGDGIVLARLSERLAASGHVNRAVILALDGAVDAQGKLDHTRTEIYMPNEFLAAEVAKHTNLLWGASINPYRPDALERLEWARAHGAVLVKWLPSIMNTDPADKRLIPFLTHAGNEHSFTKARDELCDPERLLLPLREGVTIIAAHAATTGKFYGERAFDRLARMMPANPNLYADISSLTQLNKLGYLGEALHHPEFQGRLVYGTDHPLIAMKPLVSPWYFQKQLTFRQQYAISRIKNPWDRDVALKQALGVPAEIWTRADSLLAH